MTTFSDLFGPTLYLDIETYSGTPIDAGIYRYSEDSSFVVLMAAWAVDDGPVRVETTPEGIAGIPYLWSGGARRVAHNAAFERVCLSRFARYPLGEYQPPEYWHDTQAVAGELGYPQGLDALAAALGLSGKAPTGKQLIKLFCTPAKDGLRNLPDDYPVEWETFVEYCRRDVAVLREVDRALGDFPTEMERRVYHADQVINDRGVRLDLKMAAKAVEAAEDNRMVAELKVSAATGISNPSSRNQMLSWLQGSGLDLPNLTAPTVAWALDGNLTTDQRLVLELRQGLALSAEGKYAAGLRSVSGDGRLRGGFRFFGAHTGRWSGKGMQLHNLPREQLATETATYAAIADLALGTGGDAQTLKALLRATLVGPFSVVDYSSIEARVIAWLAGEQWALEAFREGRDIYQETADRMGGLTRVQGKVAVLALGFGGGTGSLRAMGYGGRARTGDAGQTISTTTGKPFDAGTVLAARKSAPKDYLPDPKIQPLVDQWRSTNPKIVSFWSRAAAAFRRGGPISSLVSVTRRGEDRLINLPSGRSIVYHDCKFDPEASFTDPRRSGFRVRTYGGRLTENIVQAVARDVLAEALVRLAGRYPVVGHVHDEIIVEGDLVSEVTAEVTVPPSWAADLPIDAAGFTCRRYRKG